MKKIGYKLNTKYRATLKVIPFISMQITADKGNTWIEQVFNYKTVFLNHLVVKIHMLSCEKASKLYTYWPIEKKKMWQQCNISCETCFSLVSVGNVSICSVRQMRPNWCHCYVTCKCLFQVPVIFFLWKFHMPNCPVCYFH